MKKILICHAEDDKPYVDPLAQELESLGLKVWHDSYFHEDDRYKEKILDFIKDADIVLVVWSDSSVHSPQVVHAAREAGGYRILISIGLESHLGPMVAPRPYGPTLIDINDREQLIQTLAEHEIYVKGSIDEMSAGALGHYILSGVLLAASIPLSSFYMQLLVLAPIPIGLHMLWEQQRAGQNVKRDRRLHLLTTIPFLAVVAYYFVRFEGSVNALLFLLLLVVTIQSLHERTLRLGAVYSVDNPRQFRDNPRDAHIFMRYLVPVLLATAVVAWFFEAQVTGQKPGDNVIWICLGAWAVYLIILHFKAEKRALEFFQLSKDSPEDVVVLGTGTRSGYLQYLPLVFWGSILLSALYLTLSAEDPRMMLSSWLFMWIMSNIYAWRQAGVRGVLIFKKQHGGPSRGEAAVKSQAK